MLTQQATENINLLKNKLHVMAAVQPIILITVYAATFGEHIIAVHNPLMEEEGEPEENLETEVDNTSQG